MYIDGFTAGQLPPKSSIREIRINQNPFSSEYDKLGYGRIEIFTKPGTDKYHGQFFVNGNDSAFNSRNPFAGPEPGYDSTQFNGNIGGPINKNASFFFQCPAPEHQRTRRRQCLTLDPSLTPVTTVEAIPNPRQRTNIGPRLDYALTKNNTLTARYQYYRDSAEQRGHRAVQPRVAGIQLRVHRTYAADQRHPGHRLEDRQRDALPISARARHSNRADHRAGHQRPGSFQRRRQQPGPHRRPPGPLRVSELHLMDSRQSHASSSADVCARPRRELPRVGI